jgi:hypothetical protein
MSIRRRSELDKCVLVCSNCHDEIEAGVTDIPTRVLNQARAATASVPRLKRRRSGRPAQDEWLNQEAAS